MLGNVLRENKKIHKQRRLFHYSNLHNSSWICKFESPGKPEFNLLMRKAFQEWVKKCLHTQTPRYVGH